MHRSPLVVECRPPPARKTIKHFSSKNSHSTNNLKKLVLRRWSLFSTTDAAQSATLVSLIRFFNQKSRKEEISKGNTTTPLQSTYFRTPYSPEALIVSISTIASLGLPLWAEYLVYEAASITNTSFVGHLGDPLKLSCVVLATSLGNAAGYQVIHGLASASSTLLGQAYGAGSYPILSQILQRSLILCYMACIPISWAWHDSEEILKWLGQDPDIAAGASIYLQLTLPSLYMYVLTECLNQFNISQQDLKPGLVITIISSLMTPVYCWYFITNLQLGLPGAAFSICASQATSASLMLGYTLWRETTMRAQGHQQYVPLAPRVETLRGGWGPLTRLAVPALVMTCMEYWVYEAMILMSGLLHEPELAVGVTGLCMRVSTLVWLAASSIGCAAATEVAARLGKGDGNGAKQLAECSIAMALFTQFILGATTMIYQKDLFGMVTDRMDVIEGASEVMPLLSVCFIADGLNIVFSSILRGCGAHWTGAKLNIGGWWLFGVPLTFFLALGPPALGIKGLWMGFACATSVQATLQGIAVARIDWRDEVIKAQSMVLESAGESSFEEDPESWEMGLEEDK